MSDPPPPRGDDPLLAPLLTPQLLLLWTELRRKQLEWKPKELYLPINVKELLLTYPLEVQYRDQLREEPRLFSPD